MTLQPLFCWTFGSTILAVIAFFLSCWTVRRPKITDRCAKWWSRIRSLKDEAGQNPYDPPLLQKYSTCRSYTTTYDTYPSVRTFHHPHPHAQTLPRSCHPLPLLVFLHGLGGSLEQFVGLLGSLVNIAPCLGIDLPGCGLSQFSSTRWESYSLEAMATLVAHVIENHKTSHGYRNIVLIGHSLGCSVAVVLASSASQAPVRLEHVIGVVAICPRGNPLTEKQAWYSKRMLSLPDSLIDVLRWYDRRGGINSPSVSRFVGGGAGPDLRRLQYRLNRSFSTQVWKRMLWGCIPVYDKTNCARGGIPGRELWASMKLPIFLIAGQCDEVTKPQEVSAIISFLSSAPASDSETFSKDVALPFNDTSSHAYTINHEDISINDSKLGIQKSTMVRTALLPAPAAHALLYDHATYRTVAGLVEDFLSQHVSPCLNLGWQLQQRSTSGKWDVKNLEKWRSITPVSGPIAGGVFRAIKSLREQDKEHTPAVFAKEWQKEIYAVIDVSHDSPVYDPRVLERHGLLYHKFPTVSKIPPSVEDVQGFINLVERLRSKIFPEVTPTRNSSYFPAIAVHCHYGFNRTGFFLVSYLVEHEGFSLQGAIDEFSRRRPPGIRHEHFINTLFVRYCLGLKPAPIVKAVT